MFRFVQDLQGVLGAALSTLTPRRIAVLVLIVVPSAIAIWWWSTRIVDGRLPVLLRADSSLTIGCERSSARTGTFRRTTADGRGRTRSYLVDVPDNYKAGQPVGLVLGFHGRGGKGEDAMKAGVSEAGRAAGTTIFIYPDGIRYRRYGVGWDDNCDGYDMPLFDNILADMSDEYCVDTRAISAFGTSWGGDFTLALACCRGNRLQSIGVHAASDDFADPADPITYLNWKNGSCPVTSSAAIRFTHAEKEDVAYRAPLFNTTSNLLRLINACQASTRPTANKACVRYEGCTATFEECQYPGLGHTTPEGFGRETWEFLSRAGQAP